jgi:hypothetical protein
VTENSRFAPVCAGLRRSAPVCAGLRRFAPVCAGLRRSAPVDKKLFFTNNKIHYVFKILRHAIYRLLSQKIVPTLNFLENRNLKISQTLRLYLKFGVSRVLCNLK